jgi:hypothetical protein
MVATDPGVGERRARVGGSPFLVRPALLGSSLGFLPPLSVNPGLSVSA